MLWKEFVGCLDKVRADIRASRTLNAEADLRESDSIIKQLYEVLSGKNILVAVVTEEQLPANPPPPPPRVSVKTGAANSVEGAKLSVFEREGGYKVGKKPVLEEVLEEELGK